MLVDVVSNLLAVGALLANLLVVAAVAAYAAHRLLRRSAAWRLLASLNAGRGAAHAAVVAIVATSGSLFFSEVAGYPPCELCWWQRGLMYPLVLLLGISALSGHHRVWRWGTPVALVGAGVALYHIAVTIRPEIGTCRVGATSCSVDYLETAFGFMTIPYLALSAFALIVTLLLADPDRDVERADAVDTAAAV